MKYTALKTIYAWKKDVNQSLLEVGFRKVLSDDAMYVLWRSNSVTIIGLHVDDFAIVSNDTVVKTKLDNYLESKYTMKDEPMDVYVGVNVDHDEEKGVLELHQRPYVEKMLKKFDMETCKRSKIPAQVGIDLSPGVITEKDKKKMVDVPYRNAVGGLMYAVTHTMPELSLAVNQLTRFFNDPEPKHWVATKKVFKYLRGVKDMCGIKFRREGNKDLMAYVDSDWSQHSYLRRRSVSGYCVFLAGGPVS